MPGKPLQLATTARPTRTLVVFALFLATSAGLLGCADSDRNETPLDTDATDSSGDSSSCVDGCGLNASCDDGSATCVCDTGFVDTGDGCEPIVCDNDSDCDNGDFCDGVETCDVANNSCTPAGNDACVDDNTVCDENDDSCSCAEGYVDVGDGCEPIICDTDSDCDNGDFCDGVETCDVANNSCAPAGNDACVDDNTVCNEDNDACTCAEGYVDIDGSCVPVDCTTDEDCSNGDACDGAETCNLTTGTCESGSPVECTDDAFCVDRDGSPTCLVACPVPALPMMREVHADNVMEFQNIDGFATVEYALLSDDETLDLATWHAGASVSWGTTRGAIRLVARVFSDSCVAEQYLDARTSVVDNYAPRATTDGTLALASSWPGFVAWATGHSEVNYGGEVDDNWKTPENAYGAPDGNLVVLGNGGSITMTFDAAITNGPGPDFGVFENGFSDTFLELAFVEVSSDGVNFTRFDTHSLTDQPVSAYGAVQPTNLSGLAGKYKSGYAETWDLQLLATHSDVLSGLVDLNRITHVRIVDIEGGVDQDSVMQAPEDSFGNLIYDPSPSWGSAGFDLTGVGVIHQVGATDACPATCDVNATCNGELAACVCREGTADYGSGCEIRACDNDASCDNGVDCDGSEFCNRTTWTCAMVRPSVCAD